ncbi:MAG TPA: hypothetical protein DCQ20_08740, partial [Nitrospira sp.]|nr:hypothetical protein [Nitrospira sp.]
YSQPKTKGPVPFGFNHSTACGSSAARTAVVRKARFAARSETAGLEADIGKDFVNGFLKNVEDLVD